MLFRNHVSQWDQWQNGETKTWFGGFRFQFSFLACIFLFCFVLCGVPQLNCSYRQEGNQFLQVKRLNNQGSINNQLFYHTRCQGICFTTDLIQASAPPGTSKNSDDEIVPNKLPEMQRAPVHQPPTRKWSKMRDWISEKKDGYLWGMQGWTNYYY